MISATAFKVTLKGQGRRRLLLEGGGAVLKRGSDFSLLSRPIIRDIAEAKQPPIISLSSSVVFSKQQYTKSADITTTNPSHYHDSKYDHKRKKQSVSSLRYNQSPSLIVLTKTTTRHSSTFLKNPISFLVSIQQQPVLRLCSTNNQNVKQFRLYNTTSRVERAPQAAILVLGTIALTAKGGQYAIQAYNEYQKKNEDDPSKKQQEEQSTAHNTKRDYGKAKSKQESKKQKVRENIFEKYFNINIGNKYYEGGFEAKMTRREAALILGVRESSTSKRIKEAHRKLLVLNHPDTGGSTYLTGKINEAKELLLKGKQNRG